MAGTPSGTPGVSPAMRRALVPVCAALAVSGCEEGGVVAGGSSDRTVTPARDRWERTVAPANGLSGLDAVRAADKIVVVGGADYDQTEVKALVLDLDSGRWSRAARSRLRWRAGHSVVAANGQVIVWGAGSVRAPPLTTCRETRGGESRAGRLANATGTPPSGRATR